MILNYRVMKKICFLFSLALGFVQHVECAPDAKLSGTPFASPAWDYATGAPSQTVNGAEAAFDGNFSTFYASEARSLTYVGLDLGEKHVVTRIGWSPRDDYYGPGRVVLGVFQGADREDFMDAVPLYIVTEPGVIGEMSYADVECSRGFRYVRYVGPNDSRCNIAEIEFYGYKDDGDDTRMYQLSDVPTVVINTENAQEPFDKETDIVSNVIIINGGKIDTEASATVRERGNASRGFPKKPWRIKFDKKQNPLEAPAKAKKWTLINNYGDKTLMRNIIGFEISRRAGMAYTPFNIPVDVVMNGEYKGCYQFCDQVELADGRIEGIEMEKEDNDGDALSGAYHIEIDAYAADENSWFMSRRGIPVTIKSPDEDDITPQQAEYIEERFNLMESAAIGPQYGHPTKGFRNYLDLGSWHRYMLIEELVANPDQLWSIHCVKPRGDDHIYVAAVWDLDLAFDNDIRYAHSDNIQTFMWPMLNGAGGNGESQPLRDVYARVMRDDKEAVADLQHLWQNLRDNGDLSAEGLCDYVDEMAALMRGSQKLNFMRWPILSQTVHNNYQALGSWEAEVAHVKDFIGKRLAVMDRLLAYDPSGVSALEADARGVITVSEGRIITSGFGEGDSFTVYDLSGSVIISGRCGEDSAVLIPGIYIVRAGCVSSKVWVE